MKEAGIQPLVSLSTKPGPDARLAPKGGDHLGAVALRPHGSVRPRDKLVSQAAVEKFRIGEMLGHYTGFYYRIRCQSTVAVEAPFDDVIVKPEGALEPQRNVSFALPLSAMK